ncbi:MAG: ribonuclease HII [Candidatus Paceibacterota bacterium]|jgi:ribonuclease HII
MEIPKEVKYLVGIDEAGRGALAGPVAVGMFVWSLEMGELLRAVPGYPVGCDSKKLTPRKRERWFAFLIDLAKRTGAICQVSFVGESYIDRAGIVPAVTKGIEACLDKLPGEPTEYFLKLDGSLKAPEKFIYQNTIIKGDEKEPIISFASILAKVSRDKKMIKMADNFADYGLEKHKGYGTKEHFAKVAEKGLSPCHRRSYFA